MTGSRFSHSSGIPLSQKTFSVYLCGNIVSCKAVTDGVSVKLHAVTVYKMGVGNGNRNGPAFCFEVFLFVVLYFQTRCFLLNV